MDSVIREGALRLLAYEGSSDVILSCQGHRMMAHKVILSMASPVFRILLEDSKSEPAVIIFPDSSSKTMSLILDYIYTGCALVHSSSIRDFLGLAKMLQLQLDFEKRSSMLDEKGLCHTAKVEVDVERSEKLRETVSETRNDAAAPVKTNLRKLPELVPLTRSLRGRRRENRWGSYLLPSPWCPRPQGVYGDPRATVESPGRDPNNNHPALANDPPEDFSTGQARLGHGDVDQEVIEQDGKGDKPFVCVECGKRFSQLRNYKYHRSVHEGTREFAAECKECGKTFNDKGYLSSHMKIHRDKKEYGCPHCPKRFNQRVAYNMHLRIHTGVKPHECSTCGKSFSRKMLLKQHQRVHTGERPYSCPDCGKSFADRSNMSLHARLHTGEKPYGCSVCPKSFTKKHHLKTHMNFHTGVKPYECDKCGLRFSQSSNMRTHHKKCAAGRVDADLVRRVAD